jgi:acetyl-CoA carboxylase carboxyl transferase subunit alpha
VILGEGGSGGAVALATADRVLMLEHAIYSVISPEGCASILWRSSSHATDAANALKLTAQDLKSLNVIDTIIEEPLGAAHRDHKITLERLGNTIEENLNDLLGSETENLVLKRRKKFLNMGVTALI